MNMIHITPSNIQLSEKRRNGADFSVSVISRQEWERVLPEGIAHVELPKLVAIKTPILDQDIRAPRNRRIFASMMKEYRILSHVSIKQHKNIVSLRGCCWRTLDVDADRVIPNLVLEGTSLGDLEAFYRLPHQQISMRRRVGLCIDIAAGVEALHLAGIVHGDIKPRNILVFEDSQGFVAKVADFGASIFIDHATFPQKALSGTPPFSAPECLDRRAEFSAEGLLKADIFSLGITLLVSIRGTFVLDKLLSAFSADSENLRQQKCRGELNDWLNRDEQLLSSTQVARKTFGKDAAERERQQDLLTWVDRQNELRKRAEAEIISKSQSVFEDISGNWQTSQKFTLQSEHGENVFSHLINQMMSADPSMRPGSMSYIVETLQKVLRLELHDLYYSNRANRKRVGKNPSLATMCLAGPLAYRDSLIPKLNHREMNNVIVSGTNPFRELRFIWKFGKIASLPQKITQYPKHLHRKGKMSKSQRPSAFTKFQMAKVVYFMEDTCTAWRRNHKKSKTPDIPKTEIVYRASVNERYTSMLPIPVRRELIKQLKNLADSVQERGTRRVVASFEYAFMILCYPDVWKASPSFIPTALHYLHLAASSGYHHAQSVAGRLHCVFGTKMPENIQTEVEWLFQASLKGSLTAMQRLQQLDPSEYLKVSRLIRFEYNGSFVQGELWPHTELLLRLIPCGRVDVPPQFIHDLAALGQFESLNRLSMLPPTYFNTQDPLGETPLVTACRCGHAVIVALLLRLGADPKIATYRGIHPLHFLSAFEDMDIQQVANLLIKNGAILEAYCSEGDTYRQGLDGRFDVEAGTPLLWAVIAGNIQAIKSLLNLGADIFGYRRLSSRSFTNEVFIHSSPLESAITRYRFDIVELLLSSYKNTHKMKEKLNELRLVGPEIRAAPLLLALNRPTGELLRVALKHGRRLQDAQLMTVATLIRYGANPLQISQEPSGESIHPLSLVCEVNNVPLLRFLWNRSGGIYRPPSAKIFIQCLETSMHYSNEDVFNFLVSEKDKVCLHDGYEHIVHALAKACSVPKGTHYVSSLINLVCHMSSSSTRTIITNSNRPNLSIPLMASLLAGNLETAKLLCLYGDCDFIVGGQSLLADAIHLDTISPIVAGRVDMLLNLAASVLSPSAKEDLFWRCRLDENGGRQTQLTAFQFAVNLQANGVPNAGRIFIPVQGKQNVLSRILREFHGPRFLNAQVDRSSTKFPGDTALHIAAREGCVNLIDMILNEPYGSYIDLKLLNVYNQTILDLCIMHHENVINESEELFMSLGTLFTETAAARKVLELESMIDTLFVVYKCNISTFCLVVLRRTDTSFLFICRPDMQFLVAFTNEPLPECHTLFAGDEADGADLLQLRTGSLIPFVDSPSSYGKVLSEKTKDFIQRFG